MIGEQTLLYFGNEYKERRDVCILFHKTLEQKLSYVFDNEVINAESISKARDVTNLVLDSMERIGVISGGSVKFHQGSNSLQVFLKLPVPFGRSRKTTIRTEVLFHE